MLIVFEFGTLNGGERSMLAVLPELVGTEFEVVALAPSAGPLSSALGDLGVPTFPFEVRDAQGRKPLERNLGALCAAVCRVRPDLVHGNSLSMGKLTGALAAATGMACTAHLRDIVGLSAQAAAQLNSNRALVAVSKAVRSYHAAQGIEEARLQVVYNGIRGPDAVAQDSAGRLNAELDLPAGAFLIAAIGQVCLRKGQDIFAQAAARAAPGMPDAHFLLVGERYSEKPESVAYEESIGREFAAAGLGRRFHRLGHRTDVELILGDIDLVVHAARQEPFGRVLLEAGVLGRPIIATRVGGTEEMLADEETALLIPPNSSEDLAAAMRRMHGDPVLRARLGGAARERIVRQFPVEKAARGLADVWRAAIDQ